MKSIFGTMVWGTVSIMTVNAQFVKETTGRPVPKIAPAFVQSATAEELLALRDAKPFGGGVPRDSSRRVYDLAEMSDFIAVSGRTVIVPKGAILHVPERLRASVVAAPQGKLLAWQEFLAGNIALVSTLEITLEEASGAEPIAPERLETAIRSDRMIVAVLRGNPTSVHRPATEATAPESQPANNP
jgi:hypothetical protein